MLSKTNPIHNPIIKSKDRETKPIQDLTRKLEYFIEAKMPTINKWIKNDLYLYGIDNYAFEWAFSKTEDAGIVKTEVNGIEEQIAIRKTKEEIYGRYRYNNKGIPSKVKDYIDDIVAREQVADIKSILLSPNDKTILTRILQEGFINDIDWKTNIKSLLIRDLLSKGDFFVGINSYNQTRNVRNWNKLDKEGNYIWDVAEEMDYKNGCFIEYLDPELVFPEPNTDNPQEFFIAKPYSYSEFIREFPDLEKNVVKNSNEKGTLNNTPYDNKSIYPEDKFPYKITDKMIDIYQNRYKAEEFRNNIHWFNSVFNGSNYSHLYDDRKIWVWTYYNLNYNPNDNNIGDTCFQFVNYWQLYSGAIPTADKDVPFIRGSFKKNKGTYWSSSMVDELKPIQDEINEIENVKKANMGMLMTTNLAVNSKLINSNIVLDRRRVNVIDLKNEDDSPLNSAISVQQALQPLQLGSVNALESADRDILDLLSQMDTLYPKPISAVQLQPEQNIKDSNFSPVLRVNTIIHQINSYLSHIGSKFIKETIGNFRYFNARNKKPLHLSFSVLPVKVVKDEEEKSIEQAKEMLIIYNNIIQQQQDPNNPQQLIDPATIKTVELANETKIMIQQAGVPITINNTYIVSDNLLKYGSSGMDLTISLEKSRAEVIKDTQEFITVVNNIGGVTIDPSKLVKQLAILYSQNLDMLITNPPDPVVQSILGKGNFRIVSQDYLGEGAAATIRKKILGIDPVPFNPDNEKYQEYVYKTTTTVALADQSAENQTKLDIIAKQLLNDYVNSEDNAQGRSMQAPEPQTPTVNASKQIQSNRSEVSKTPNVKAPVVSEQRTSAGQTS